MELTVDSDDAGDLYSLYEWLAGDDDVVAGAGLTLAASGRRDGYQSPLDIVDVVLSNATALASLLIAYSTWRRTRPGRPSLTLHVDGTEITVHDVDDETVERVVAAARRQGALPGAEEETTA